ncbi:hypothetical protein ACOSQ2_010951 [Xanthoceras sorbifolium]
MIPRTENFLWIDCKVNTFIITKYKKKLKKEKDIYLHEKRNTLRLLGEDIYPLHIRRQEHRPLNFAGEKVKRACSQLHKDSQSQWINLFHNYFSLRENQKTEFCRNIPKNQITSCI